MSNKTNSSEETHAARLGCYRSPKTRVAGSVLAGRGLFASEAIRQGEVVAVKAGHIITGEQLVDVATQVGDYALQIHDNLYLGPVSADEVDDLTIFINHSCEPNVGFDGQVVYVALRDIAPGEELCHDYAMARADDYRLDCHCGASRCRRIITGSDWMNPELQQRYGDYFSSFILRKMRCTGRQLKPGSR